MKSEVLLSVICISLCSRPHLWLRYNMVNKYWRSYFQDKLSDKLKTKKKPPNSDIHLNSDMVWTKQIFKHFHIDVPARHFALLKFRILAGTRPYSSQPNSQLSSHIRCSCHQKSRFSCSLVSSREHDPTHTGRLALELLDCGRIVFYPTQGITFENFSCIPGRYLAFRLWYPFLKSSVLS